MDEMKFNRLNAQDRLSYMINKFHVGMYITVNVKDKPIKSGKIYGFYDSSSYPDSVREGKVKAYNEVPDDCRLWYYTIVYGNPHTKLPQCNIFVEVDGKIESYYPLWVYPDYCKIRNNKLELIGIREYHI
jgi:hypothetical protein